MAHMTDANDVKCGECLIVGQVGSNAEGKYFEKNLSGKAASGGRQSRRLEDKDTDQWDANIQKGRQRTWMAVAIVVVNVAWGGGGGSAQCTHGHGPAAR